MTLYLYIENLKKEFLTKVSFLILCYKYNFYLGLSIIRNGKNICVDAKDINKVKSQQCNAIYFHSYKNHPSYILDVLISKVHCLKTN